MADKSLMESLKISKLDKFRTDSNTAIIAGGLAGVVSRTVVSPFERVKILLQVQNSVENTYNNGILNAIKKIYKDEGGKGLFRGNGLNCVRIFPYSAVQFLVYEYTKRHIFHVDDNNSNYDKNNYKIQNLTNLQRFIAGSLGAACSLIVTQPLDLVRIRLSVQTANLANLTKSKAKNISKPPNFLELITKIYKTEGGILGLYRGMVSTGLQVIPCVALNFMFYGKLKELYEPKRIDFSDKNGARNNIRTNKWESTIYKLTFGAVSGAFAQFITYPFDVLRKRFQIMNMGQNEMGFQYKSIMDGIITIGRKEGYHGYYKGLTASLCKFVPSTAVSWVVYELTCDLLKF